MQTELLDIYDQNNQALNITVPRKEAHLKGLWHRCLHFWIVTINSQGALCMLMQIRADTKDSFPGLVDISAAGHYTQGEADSSDRFREVEEEIGLTVEQSKVKYLGTRRCLDLSTPGFINNEFQEVYLHFNPKQIESYQVQVTELKGLLLIPIEDGILFFNRQIDNLLAEVCFVNQTTKVGLNTFTEQNLLDRTHFVKGCEKYFIKVFLQASLLY